MFRTHANLTITFHVDDFVAICTGMNE